MIETSLNLPKSWAIFGDFRTMINSVFNVTLGRSSSSLKKSSENAQKSSGNPHCTSCGKSDLHVGGLVDIKSKGCHLIGIGSNFGFSFGLENHGSCLRCLNALSNFCMEHYFVQQMTVKS